MINQTPPFDDSLQLEDMPVDFSDTEPIVEGSHGGEVGSGDVVVVTPEEGGIGRGRGIATVAILFFINLINYMDRYTIAGVLKDIQNYYDITSSEDGLIQTCFILSYMVVSPVFGYMGDRFTRKYILAAGIFFWSGVTLAGSFVPPDKFYAFAILRSLVGIGEASYSTIAPTLIADLFVGDRRTRMLMAFYFAIPVGSGMGYIVGSNVAKAAGAWQYSLRVTPAFGVICSLLVMFVVKEPRRGQAEGGVNLHNTDVLVDLKYLVRNKSFMLSSLGFTCVAFVAGAMAFWSPLYVMDSIQFQDRQSDEATVSLIFGIITVLAGFIGVALGAETSRRYKRRNPRSDPLVCAFGLITCAPFLYFAIVVSRYNEIATWILIFVGETMLCLNWCIVADILLYVVIPTRRSTAESVQILMSHALGDAGSPYLIGVISDSLAKTKYPHNDPQSAFVQFNTLQTALYMTPFVCVLGGGFFLAAALFVEEDKHNADKIIKGESYNRLSDTDSDDDLLLPKSDVEEDLRALA
ncbi:hypothetical protein ScPMuIL_005303 [Solemya velum]